MGEIDEVLHPWKGRNVACFFNKTAKVLVSSKSKSLASILTLSMG